MRRACFLSAIVLTAVLCVSGIGLAAEPQKNQIVVEASCSNGQDYTFVINGMSKTGDVEESTSNVVVKQYTVEYYDVQNRKKLLGSDTFEFGNKKVLEGDLIHCIGETETELQGLGLVRAVYDFQAFVTPRGEA